MKRRKVIRAIISIIIVVAVLAFLQRLVTPKYVDDVIEGALIAEYYEDAPNHDVVFIGDCEVYENFSPQLLFDEYGINSYIRGSAQQLIWQSYYLLEDTLKYEKPDVVVFNILSMKYDKPQHEAYNRMTLEGMRWSMSKVNSIFASMTSDENFIDYVFPILRYHSRISELKETDFEYMFHTKHISHNGYYLRVDVKPAENVPEGPILADYQFGENSYKYLDMMTELCEREGIKLVLIKAPSLYPYWYDEWEEQMENYASEHNLTYINFLDADVLEATGVDFSQDTYDGGLHLNLSGAEKITRYFGEYLRDEVGLKDRRGEEPLTTFWDEKREAYDEDIASQYAALEEKKKQNASQGDGNAQNSQGVTVKPGEENENHKGYTLRYMGRIYAVDEPVAGALDALGEPQSYYEAPSCAFEGLDKIYTYANITIDTYPDADKNDLISCISLKDDTITTREGAMIGMFENEIRALYGDPTSDEGAKWVYEKDGMKLNFIFRDGKVALIEYRTTALDE